jgi:hypothetical protein
MRNKGTPAHAAVVVHFAILALFFMEITEVSLFVVSVIMLGLAVTMLALVTSKLAKKIIEWFIKCSFD